MGRRLALLVATYDYQDTELRQLTAPAHDAEALAAVLRDPDIAGFEVTILLNQPHHVVGEAVGDFYRDRRRDDLTLLYFTGHGLKDDEGQLYLAMVNTRRDNLRFTGLGAEQINQAMESCVSRQKVLILDCCYSGAFPAGRISKADTAVHTLERFRGSGRTVLTASDATQYSFEGDQAHGQAPRSVFTHYLVEGLRDGSADLDGDGDITLDELYSYVHDRVVDEMPQQRPKRQDNVEGRTVIARNINWSLPGHLRNAIDSPLAKDRLGAVEGLGQLHRIGNEYVRAAVGEELRGLTDDDSRQVSAAAAQRLGAVLPRPAEPVPAAISEPPAAPPAAPAEPEPSAEAGRRSDSISRGTQVLGYFVVVIVGLVLVVLTVIFNDNGEKDDTPSDDSSTSGGPITPYRTLSEAGTDVEFSADGKILITSDDQSVRVWQGDMTEPALTLSKREFRDLSPDGRLLATQFSDGEDEDGVEVEVRDLVTGGTVTLHTSTGNARAAFSPDGKSLATASTVVTASYDATVLLWDTETGKLRDTLTGHTNGLGSMAFTPDSKVLVTASTDHSVRQWETATGKNIRTIGGGAEDYIFDMTLSPDGTTIATWAGTRPTRLWSRATGEGTATLNAPGGGVFSPDSTLFAYADGGKVRLRSVGAPAESEPTPFGGAGRPFRFSPDGKTLATNAYGSAPAVLLWNVSTGKRTGKPVPLVRGADKHRVRLRRRHPRYGREERDRPAVGVALRACVTSPGL
jgi:WD40 repeat protein